jgi:hypothetical protein
MAAKSGQGNAANGKANGKTKLGKAKAGKDNQSSPPSPLESKGFAKEEAEPKATDKKATDKKSPDKRTPAKAARAEKAKKPAAKAASPGAKPVAKQAAIPSKAKSPADQAFSGIPEAVSKRMARRALVFCGFPTALGMLTFIISYFIVSQNIYKLPTVAVLLVSLGFFGLGVVGLSYGAFSASWDEKRLGGWFGFSEFKTNFGRTVASWKAAQQRNTSSPS